MKRHMNARHHISRRLLSVALAASLALPLASLAASVTLATSPLATTSTSSVSPNLMFILDDSGSMDWSYMPDNANDFNGAYGYATNQCNGVYYDPNVTYSPPVYYGGTSYPNSSFTAAWNDGYNTGAGTTNLNTSFQPTSSYTAGKAFYYFYSGSQNSAAQKNYYDTSGVFYNECNSAAGTPTAFDTSSDKALDGTFGPHPVNTVFTKRTLATTENTYITVSSGSSATITVDTASGTFRLGNITVSGAGGGNIMSGRSSTAGTTGGVAANIAAKINSCTIAIAGSCTVAGYSATASGNVVTINGPAAGGATMTFSVNQGSWTYTASAFSTTVATAVSSIKVNGVELLLSGATASTTSTSTLASSVAAGINAAGYSAVATGNTVTVTGPSSAANHTPVITTDPATGGMTLFAGTFPETDSAKLTNFANWYSYYRTRMLMMKTSTGLAFKPIDDKFRVGFMTINNNNSPDVVDLKPFGATQKNAWYAKLYAANPGSWTPLREALAKAGRFYAHKSTTLNTLAVNDPIQYSCQQNFTILSTDGFWNGNAGFKMDGTTAVGNQDGAAPRPLFDGALANKVTTQVWQTKKQVTQSTSQMQKRTLQVQSQTSALQSSTSVLQQVTTQQQQRTKTLQFQTGALQKATSADSGSTWSAWSNAASCTWNSSAVGFATITVGGSGNTLVSSIMLDGVTEIMSAATNDSTNKNTIATRIAAKITLAGYSATSSNEVVYVKGPTSGALVITDNGGGHTFTVNVHGGRTKCRYAALSALANSPGTCTNNDQSNNTSNGTTWSGDKVACQYTGWSAAANVASCTPVAQSGSSPYTVLTAVDCPTATTTTTVSPCTVTAPDASGVSTSCQYAAWSSPANVSSCTDVSRSAGPTSFTVGTATQCSYTAYTAWANASSCTPLSQSAGSPYTVGTATNCQTTDTGWVNVSSCSPGVAGGQTVTCQTFTTGPTPVASCTAAAAASGNNWTATSCTTTTVSPKTLVASCACTAGPSCTVTGGAPDYLVTTCDIVTTTANNVSSCTPQTASAGNNYTTIACSAGSGGTSDTLADVAMYYYQTDLRDETLWNNCIGGGTGADGTGAPGDVCENNVYISGDDNNTKQHMTTFTLGLGARGRMVYSPSYQSDLSGDFVAVKNGSIADLTTTPPTCSWQANGTVCNWPVPASSAIENIDDLWHAAVDGRGTYFSATDPGSLATGLSRALSSITARKGSAAAAATSTLNPVAGNNFAYVASYTTVKWIGNLEARSINITNGVISEAATWCVENVTGGTCAAPSSVVVDSSGASAVYNCVTPGSTAASCTSPAVFDSVTSQCTRQMPVACAGTMPALVGSTTDTRTIYTSDRAANPSLVPFIYANLLATDFDAAKISSLSQWAMLTADQKTAAAGANLVNFLRGQYGFEERTANLVGTVDNRVYRYREAVLGDALESQPAYLGPPVFSYTDRGYAEFKSARSARPGTVYMGANDGMLHAFAADTGVERWAYVPSMVIPNMWILADRNYDIKHANFVNGSPTMSDVCVANCNAASADWRTILVGGLNGGGRGYYALDITDPTAPALLWEFTTADDANVGYSFGQPIITKMTLGNADASDDVWVVLVTSGYNNTSPGDGKGYLYVLNALTGAIVKAIPTGVGDTTTPSGLAKISGWSSEPASNVASFVYGGDLLGDVWRFNINAATSATNPLLFATLKDPSGAAQPITTSPVLGLIKQKRVIFVGTGKYLESLDLTNTQVQSTYAIKDDDATATLANPRTHTTAPKMVNQTLTTSGSFRTTTTPVNPVDFGSDRGWYIDFPDSGERVNIDSRLVQGTLLVPTIVPRSTVCSPGGYGWLNFFDYETGGPVIPTGPTPPGGPIASVKYDSTIVGLNIIYIEGAPIVEVVTSSDPTPRIEKNVTIPGAAAEFVGKRMQWRELIP